MRSSHHEVARCSRTPRRRDVPVVVHVVVVEDHGARHGGEQPADVGVAPGLLVETCVLLEVRDLLAGWPARVAPRADEGARLLRRLVRVDLVAQQQQAVRATARAPSAGGARAPRARRRRTRADAPTARRCTAAAPDPRRGRSRRRGAPGARAPACELSRVAARPPAARRARRRDAPRRAGRSPRRGRSARPARSDAPPRRTSAGARRAPRLRTLHPSPPRPSLACCRCSAEAVRERDLAWAQDPSSVCSGGGRDDLGGRCGKGRRDVETRRPAGSER